MYLQKSMILPLAALWLGSSSVHAEEAGDAASFSLQVPGLSYSGTESKTKVDSADEESSKDNTLSTSDWGASYATIATGKWYFYLYPFNQTKEVAAGYMITDKLEVGLGFGFNSGPQTEGEQEFDFHHNIVSPYLTFYADIGPYESEHILTLRLDQETKKYEVANASGNEEAPAPALLADQPTKEIKNNSTGIRYDLNLLQPLAKNFWLVHGLTLQNTSGKETKTFVDNTERKTKESETTWSINLVGVRITL